MPATDATFERQGLLRSIAVTAVLGAIGIVWGLAIGSQMILLDGIYAVIGIAVSWLLLLASKLVASGPSRRYPFGREGAAPLVIGVQGFVLLATLLYAASESVLVIVDGGSDVAAGWAIAYGVITAVVSVAFFAWLRSNARDSDLLVAETTAWKVAMLRGAGMVVGFTVLALLARSSWDAAVPYVDPAMVLITCAATVSAPIRMVRTTIVELLEGAPDVAIREPVLAAIASVRATHDLGEVDILMTKLGPKLYVELSGYVAPDVTVAQEHAVREDLRTLLDRLPYEVWLNVELLPRSTDA